MKKVKRRLRAYYVRNLIEPDEFPFDDSFPVEQRNATGDGYELLFRCAGLILAIGLMGLTAGLWGNSDYSPVQRAMNIEGLQEKIPLLSEKILMSYK